MKSLINKHKSGNEPCLIVVLSDGNRHVHNDYTIQRNIGQPKHEKGDTVTWYVTLRQHRTKRQCQFNAEVLHLFSFNAPVGVIT